MSQKSHKYVLFGALYLFSLLILCQSAISHPEHRCQYANHKVQTQKVHPIKKTTFDEQTVGRMRIIQEKSNDLKDVQASENEFEDEDEEEIDGDFLGLNEESSDDENSDDGTENASD